MRWSETPRPGAPERDDDYYANRTNVLEPWFPTVSDEWRPFRMAAEADAPMQEAAIAARARLIDEARGAARHEHERRNVGEAGMQRVAGKGLRTMNGPVEATPEAGRGQPSIDPSRYTNRATNGERGADTISTADPFTPPSLGADRDRTRSWEELLLGIDLAAAGIRLLDYSNAGALLEVLPPEAQLTPESWGDGPVRTRITMPGYSRTLVSGMPEVPAKGILLVTPWIERAGTEIREAESRALRGLQVVRTGEVGIKAPRVGGAPRAPRGPRPHTPPIAAGSGQRGIQTRRSSRFWARYAPRCRRP